MIYLDNAATSYFKPENVVSAISEYLRCPGNPDRGVNEASVRSSALLLDARICVAEFFGFDKFTNIVFTSGDTESLNIAISGTLHKTDHVVTTYFEHNSVLRPLYKKRCGISFTDGSVEQIKQCVKKNTKAVIVSHASNVTGHILDINKIGKFCKENGLLFIVDGAQSAGVVPIDVIKSGIDILCFSGHKGLLGMQGIGGIVVNTDKHIEPFKVGGTGVKSFFKTQPDEYPHHLEAGTLNVPGIISMHEGIKYINSIGIENIYNHELNLRNIFLDYIKTKKNVTVYNVQNGIDKVCSVVSMNITNMDAAFIGDYLSANGIAIRTGAHCAPKAMEYLGIDSCARFSFGLNNTKEDVKKTIEVLDKIL